VSVNCASAASRVWLADTHRGALRRMQALALDPVVDRLERAERLIDVMLEVEGDFLPPLR